MEADFCNLRQVHRISIKLMKLSRGKKPKSLKGPRSCCYGIQRSTHLPQCMCEKVEEIVLVAVTPQVCYPDWLLLLIKYRFWGNGEEIAEAATKNANGQHPARVCCRIRVWCIKRISLNSLLQPRGGVHTVLSAIPEGKISNRITNVGWPCQSKDDCCGVFCRGVNIGEAPSKLLRN